jgi:hypothetical protein
MKKLSFLVILMSLLVITSLSFVSCNKDRLTDDDLEAVNDNSTASGVSQEVQNITEQSITNPSNMSFRNSGSLSTCSTITNDTINKILTIDFGTSPCLCKDNRYRQGQIIASYTGRYRDSGTVINITFNNFYVGPTTSYLHNVTGQKQIINNGHNSSGNLYWTITANLNVIKPNNGGTITMNETKTREMIAGSLTPTIFSDDKFKINGTCNGVTTNNISYSATVVSGNELIRDMSCPKHFTQGQVDITIGSKPNTLLDYGTGSCDNTATVTRNGKTKTINLR